MDKLPITVVIPTLNESSNIADAIASVVWAQEVIVADGGSTDDTCAKAREKGAIVLERSGPTIGAQRNAAIDKATHPWILALDADERGSDLLRGQLAAMLENPTHDAYRVRRENRYLGRVARYGRFARDWHTCVFKSAYRYDDSKVHEGLVGSPRVGRLNGPILHTPYRNLRHHMSKLVKYADWAAADRVSEGQETTTSAIVLKPMGRFVRDYVLYSGWRDGWRGAVAAMMSAFSVFLRTAMIRERQPRS